TAAANRRPSMLQPGGAGTSAGTCRQPRSDGSPCRGAARSSGYCFAHDPALAGKQAVGRRRGGRERLKKAACLPSDAPDLPLASTADVVAMLATTIHHVRRGEVGRQGGDRLPAP